MVSLSVAGVISFWEDNTSWSVWSVLCVLLLGHLFVSQVRGQSTDFVVPSEVKIISDADYQMFDDPENRASAASQRVCDETNDALSESVHRLVLYVCESPNPCREGSPNWFIYEGETQKYGLRTTRKPSSDVSVSVNLPDNTGLPIKIISSRSDLTFTQSNWCKLQDVYITAVNNNTTDENQENVVVKFIASGGGISGTANKEQTVRYRYVFDNEEQGITIEPAFLKLEIVEGSSGIFSYRLDAEPSGDGTTSVTVKIGDPPEEVTVSLPKDKIPQTTSVSSNFVGGEGDWDRIEKVTVHAGEDDDAVDDMVKIIVDPQAGGYSFLDDYVINVTVKDNDTRGLQVSPRELPIDEGDCNQYTIHQLNTKPTKTVTVSITSDNDEVTVDTDLTTPGDQSSLEFTMTNWKDPQSVKVCAAEDDDAIGDLAELTNTPSGGDYNSVIPVKVDVTVNENDKVGLIVTTTKLHVNEGESNTYAVRLATQPSATVTVDVTGATGEVTVDTDPNTDGNQTTLTFTASNWNDNQTVTVSAGADDDGVNDSATLTNTASGGDYELISENVEVTVIDNDEINLIGSTDVLSIVEGDQGTYTINLSTEPTVQVTITIVSDNLDITIDTDPSTDGDQTTLTFTGSNWDDGQTVTVSAHHDDDGVNDSAILDNTASGGEYQGKEHKINVTVIDNDDQQIIVDPTDFRIREGEVGGPYTVKLATEPTANVRVTITPSQGGLTLNPSFLDLKTSNWKNGLTITVTANQDDDAIDNVITLTHRARGGDYGETVKDAIVTVTVNDNDEAKLMVNPQQPLKIKEGNSKTYTVSLSTQPSKDVTVTVTGESGEITVNPPKTWTFNSQNWQTPQKFTVRAGEDGDVINDKATLINTATGAEEYASLDPVNVEVEVIDNDEIGLIVKPSTMNVAEGESDSYTVSLAAQPTDDVTVTITGITEPVTVDTDPSTPGDQNTLIFTTSDWGDKQKTVTVIANDDPNGADETVTLTNTASGGDYQSAAPEDVTVNVIDEDKPEIVVTPTSVPLDEGGHDTYTVSLSLQPTSAVTVTVTSPSEKVTIGDDLNALSGQHTLSFAPNTWIFGQIVTVNAEQDDDASNETVTLMNTASGADEYTSAPRVPVVVTITDDDKPALIVTPTELPIPEGQNNSYTIKLATRPTTNVGVSVTGASGDVLINRSFLNFDFSNWDTPQEVEVLTREDDDAVDDPTVTLVNQATGGEYSASQPVSVQVTVIDDGRPSTSLSVDSTSIVEGGTVKVTIDLASSLTVGATIPLKYTDRSTNPIDFESRPESVTIQANQSSGFINIVTRDDETDEPNESFTVAIDITPEVKLGAPSSERITIIDNDLPPPTTVEMHVDDTSVVEGTPVTITVKLYSELIVPVTIPFSYSTGTGNPADPKSDYTQLNSLMIPAGETEIKGQIQTILDDDVEGAETFSVSFGEKLPPEVREDSPISIGITILDNLSAVTLSADPTTIREGDETNVSVKLSRPLENDVMIPLILTPDTASPADYQALPHIKVNRGSTFGEIRILAVNDDLIENDEQFSVRLGSLPAPLTEETESEIVVTIQSEDRAGIDAESSVVISEGGQRTVPISLTAQPITNILVTATGYDNSDLEVDPVAFEFTPSSWNQTRNLNLTAREDDDFNHDNVRLTLVADGGNFDDVDHFIDVEIIDDDRPGLVIERTLEINEGQSKTLVVRLTQLPTDDVSLTLAGYEGRTDLSLQSSPQLLFTTTNWKDDQFFKLKAEEDDDAMGDQVVLTLDAIRGGYDAVNESVTVTIVDNDEIDMTVTPSGQIIIPEGDMDVLTVVLTSAPSSDVSVTITGYENTDLYPSKINLTFTRFNWSVPQ